MARHRLTTAGPGRPKGSKNRDHKDIAAVIDTIRKASDEGTVETAVKRLWRQSPGKMISFFGRVAPKDLTVRAPDGLGAGPQMDWSKLSAEEKEQAAQLIRKAQGGGQ